MGVFNPSGDLDVGTENVVTDNSRATAIEGISKALQVGGTLLSKSTKKIGGLTANQLAEASLDKSFARDLSKIAVIRDQKGDAAARLAEQKFIRNYVANGGEFNSANKEAITKITGRPFETFGGIEDQEQAQKLAIMNSPEFTGAFAAAKYSLPKGTSDEEIVNYAIGDIQANAALERELKVTTTHDTATWKKSGEATYGQAIDKFYNRVLGGLVITEDSGGFVDQQQARAALTEWQSISGNFLQKPANISASDFAAIRTRIENTTTLLKSFVNNTSNDTLAADIVRKVVETMPKDSAIDNGFRALALSDLQATMKHPSMTAEGVRFLKRWRALEKDPEKARESAINGTPPTSQVQIDAKSDKEKAEFATESMKWAINGQDYSKEETRVQGIRTINESLAHLSNTQGIISSNATIAVFNGKTIEAIQAIEKSDPEAGNALRNQAISTIDSQVVKTKANQQALLKDSNLTFDGAGELTLDLEAIKKEFTAPQVELIVKDFNKAKERGTFLTEGVVLQDGLNSPVVSVVHSSTVKSLVDRNKTLTALNDTRNGLLPNSDIVTPQSPEQPVLPENVEDRHSFIKGFEGFRSKPYDDGRRDSNGKRVGPPIYRAGYGSDTYTTADGKVHKVTKDSFVSREDADRDFERREAIFASQARDKAGPVWDEFAVNVTTGLTSLAYNYGSLPNRIMAAVRSGDIESIALAVESLAGDNGGINRNRRLQEAALIRGEITIAEGVSTTRGTPLEQAILPPTQSTPTSVEAPVASQVAVSETEGPDQLFLDQFPSEDKPQLDTETNAREQLEREKDSASPVRKVVLEELATIQEGNSGLDEQSDKVLKTMLNLLLRADPDGDPKEMLRAIKNHKDLLKARGN